MKKHQGISLILSCVLSFGISFSQSGEKLIDTAFRDNLAVVSDAFQENFFESLKHKTLGNHLDAIQALEKCLELCTDEPAVYLELGKNHNSLSNHSKAAAYLEDARNLVPDHETILTELYKAYFLDQRIDQALGVVAKLVELDSDYSEDLANLYFFKGDYKEALEILDGLDQEKGSDSFRNGLRRQIYMMTDDTNAKIADLEHRIDKDPEEEQHYLNLIFVYSEAGDAENAFLTAKRLLDAKPSSELAHLVLYKFYLERREEAKALESMKILLKGHKVDEEKKYQVLRELLLYAETNQDIQKHLNEVVELFTKQESNVRVYEELGDFYVEQQDFSKALNYFEQGLVDGISRFDLMLKALLLQIQMGKHEDLLDLSDRGLKYFPSEPLLCLLQGTALNQENAFERAASKLENGLEYINDDFDMEVAFYEQLVVAYRALGNNQKAANFARKVAELKLMLLDG